MILRCTKLEVIFDCFCILLNRKFIDLLWLFLVFLKPTWPNYKNISLNFCSYSIFIVLLQLVHKMWILYRGEIRILSDYIQKLTIHVMHIFNIVSSISYSNNIIFSTNSRWIHLYFFFETFKFNKHKIIIKRHYWKSLHQQWLYQIQKNNIHVNFHNYLPDNKIWLF